MLSKKDIINVFCYTVQNVKVNRYKTPTQKNKKKLYQNTYQKALIKLFCYTIMYINVNRYKKLFLLHSDVCKYKQI